MRALRARRARRARARRRVRQRQRDDRRRARRGDRDRRRHHARAARRGAGPRPRHRVGGGRRRGRCRSTTTASTSCSRRSAACSRPIISGPRTRSCASCAGGRIADRELDAGEHGRRLLPHGRPPRPAAARRLTAAVGHRGAHPRAVRRAHDHLRAPRGDVRVRVGGERGGLLLHPLRADHRRSRAGRGRAGAARRPARAVRRASAPTTAPTSREYLMAVART